MTRPVLKVLWPTEQLDAMGVKVADDLRRFGVEFIQELNNAVVENTPVKTGNLKGSWFGDLNAEPEGEGSPGRAGSAVAEMNAAAQDFRVGDVWTAVNTAAYAAFVEYGTRHMTPRAFVRSALANVQSIADTVARRIMAS